MNLEFAQLIKKIRHLEGWNTQQMAEACGVSRRTVEGWEQGRPPEKYLIPLIKLALKHRREI